MIIPKINIPENSFYCREFMDVIDAMREYAKENCKKNKWYKFNNKIMVDNRGALYIGESYLLEIDEKKKSVIYTEYELMELKENEM